MQAGEEALEQQLLLVLDVVVDRRLGHAEVGGDVVERSVVVAARVESASRGPDHRVALHVVVAWPATASGPGRGRRIRVLGRAMLRRVMAAILVPREREVDKATG